MPTELRAGDPAVLGGHEVRARLGEGGQGVVYLGANDQGERVAIKWLRPHLAGDAVAAERFAREAAAAQRVAPFCTARVLATGVHEERPYIISEYVDGPSLARAVAEQGPRTGASLHRLAVGTATALAAVHQAGIVHRDFSPANVILGSEGPRVIDFGIARALDATSAITSMPVGTPAFMAPEQILGHPAGPAADLFAWAATMAFAATGSGPFDAATVPDIIQRVLHAPPNLSHLPAPLHDIATACLSKDPALRPTAEQVLVRLLEQPAAGPAPINQASTLASGPRQPPWQPPSTPPPSAGSMPGSGTQLPGPQAPGSGTQLPGSGPQPQPAALWSPPSGAAPAFASPSAEPLPPSNAPDAQVPGGAPGFGQQTRPPAFHAPAFQPPPYQPPGGPEFGRQPTWPSPQPAPRRSGRNWAIGASVAAVALLAAIAVVVVTVVNRPAGPLAQPTRLTSIPATPSPSPSSSPIPTAGLTSVRLPDTTATIYESPADPIKLTTYLLKDAKSGDWVYYTRDSLTGSFTPFKNMWESMLSPDGRYLAQRGKTFVDGYDSVEITDKVTAQRFEIRTSKEPLSAYVQAWSRDSTRVLVNVGKPAGDTWQSTGFAIVDVIKREATLASLREGSLKDIRYGFDHNDAGVVALALDAQQQTLRFFDADGRRVRSVPNVGGGIADMMFSPSGKRFVTDCPGLGNGNSCVYESATGAEVIRVVTPCYGMATWYDEEHLVCWVNRGGGSGHQQVQVIDFDGASVRTMADVPTGAPDLDMIYTFTRRN
ncbi:protein kinase [Nonomuraea sp. FMUSA5-5]|uniref:Protein kinase n=1 Tax=Nonomuraea composti TaxID=2720023 RepID=A0ABX1BHY0_9ACTN|nr:serine/threonine-protein kinase [Nonomuraea sp. FMUSA5-5]NJP94698.1 protein kinase [Nonomuraea sp. FMUSA5-5]